LHPDSDREYYQRTIEARRAYDKERRATGRDNLKRWYALNPTKNREYIARRRALKMNSTGTHTAADITAQNERQSYHCYWCGTSTRKAYHVDHVIPLSLGGSDGTENIVIACPTCNCSKGAKHPMDYAGVLC
jgi:5-methylcytosine-specific restriction endonuclease McrA